MKRHPEDTMNKVALIIIGVILALALGLVGCTTISPPPPTPAPAPAPTPSPMPTRVPVAQDDIIKIEIVMREYFAAFSDYDVDRVGALIAEETLNSEGTEILEAVLFAKGINLKMELTAIDIQIDGETAIAVTTLKTSLGSGGDTYKLVREDGNWKIHSKIPSSS